MKNKGIAPPYTIDNYGWKKTKGIMCPLIIDDYGLQQINNIALSLSLMCFHNKGIIIQDHNKKGGVCEPWIIIQQIVKL